MQKELSTDSSFCILHLLFAIVYCELCYAFEYLLGIFAQSVCMSGGEYYTPQEVSELLAKISILV